MDKNNNNLELIIFCDGGARGNPGPAGLGVAIYDKDKNILEQMSEYLGVTTNNQAEYRAVLKAIERVKELGASKLTFYLDSELIVKQMSGEYRVKNKELLPIYLKIRQLILNFEKVDFFHVRREANKEADRLANIAMDKKGN
ncbi:MAG: ribonuclease HI family protein [Candidatus Pacebacteria bacterium]|nr:ribonuclease HI family protein [Candidatus Paceibacterota bacterium]